MSPAELRDRSKTYGRKGQDIEQILRELEQLQNSYAENGKGKRSENLMINSNN